MARRVLERRQVLPVPISEAWLFFSSPRNLALITPPDMGFAISEPFDGSPLHDGQVIKYVVKPLFGVPVTWVTSIEGPEPPYRFVDVQVKGPFKYWRHEHTFRGVDEGTLVLDRVEYELPLGLLGELVHGVLVRKRLERIFDFRTITLERLFNGGGGAGPEARAA